MLEFLLPHIQDRNTITNIEYDSVSEESRHDVEINETAENDNDTPVPTLTDNQPQSNSISQSILRQNTTQVNQSHRRKRRQNQVSSVQPSASASQTLMEYIINNKKNAENIDPIDAFFKGLAPTIKRFSPYYQHLARARIFQVVQELEWEQLSFEPNSFVSNSSSLSTISSPSQSTPTPPPPQSTAPIHLQSQTLSPDPDPMPSTSFTPLPLIQSRMSTQLPLNDVPTHDSTATDINILGTI